MEINQNFSDLSQQYLATFEPQLNQAVAFDVTNDNRTTLVQAIQHSVSIPGKRIRPLICMSINQSLRGAINIGTILGVAIELIHCYSLIHDDLPAMDNDDLRRGQPTCHVKYGQDMAILAGDTLNSYAFEYLSDALIEHIPAERALRIIHQLAKACGIHGMAGGQALDLKAHLDDDLSQLNHVHLLKTGALLNACFTLTAHACMEHPSPIYAQIGHHVGLLFQIIDDIADAIGTVDSLGKSPGKDEHQHKLTYVSKLGIEAAQTHARHHKQMADDLIDQLDVPHPDLRIIIDYIYSKGFSHAH